MTTGQIAGLAAAVANDSSLDVANFDPVPLPGLCFRSTWTQPGADTKQKTSKSHFHLRNPAIKWVFNKHLPVRPCSRGFLATNARRHVLWVPRRSLIGMRFRFESLLPQ